MMAKRSLSQRNRNVMMSLVGVVAGMIGLAYASVPLYDLFCKATGFGGTPQRAETNNSIVGTRDMTVTFNTDLGAGMPWHFRPEVPKMEVRTGVPSFNVEPEQAGIYFNKIHCFCFDKQVLQPGERVEMPVVFFLDPKLEQDPYLDKLRDVTLAYTFFQVENDPVLGDVSKEINQPAEAGQGGGS